jgi:hypothetical protein
MKSFGEVAYIFTIHMTASQTQKLGILCKISVGDLSTDFVGQFSYREVKTPDSPYLTSINYLA